MSSELQAVSCVSSTHCEAVGSYEKASGAQFAFAALWNATAWIVQPTPKVVGGKTISLDGVSCFAATTCEAVGDYISSAGHTVPLAEAWNGTAWAIQRAPIPSGSTDTAFSAVSCTSAGPCEAVGNAGSQALAEKWTGSAWDLQTTPVPSGSLGGNSLFGVSCSSPKFCEAVGYYDSNLHVTVLAERWTGAAWAVQTTPNPLKGTNRALVSVSCASRSVCEAEGSAAASTLAEDWNGASWGDQSISGPGSPARSFALDHVSCSSATSCVAVGNYVTSSSANEPFADSFNGELWSSQTTPSPTGGLLNSVSCPPNGACQAVGSRVPGPGSASEPLVMGGR